VKYGFYLEALEQLADHQRPALIADKLGKVVIPDHRLLWLTTLAVDQGYEPVVISFNKRLNKYFAYSSLNGLYLFIEADDVYLGELTLFND
jgi:hypothetical protein